MENADNVTNASSINNANDINDNSDNVANVAINSENPRNNEDQTRRIKDVQQDFADNLGYRDRIIWDLYPEDEASILKMKIRELIPDQETGQNKIDNMREVLFNTVWAQRKYTNKILLATIIFVCVSEETDFNYVTTSEKHFTCHPVFRTRKCISTTTTDDSSNCCMIFIDENGRVYQNWKQYVNDNELPEGTMVAPKSGIYSFDRNGDVELDVYATPASSLSSKLLKVADTTSAVTGFASFAITAAAAITLPVAAPLLALSAGIGLTAAGYSAIRSGTNLYDRSQHEQSISITDRQARNSWLGVAAGTIGLGAVGATRVLTTAAATGQEISALSRGIVNSINVSSILLSGAGVTNGAIDIILKFKDDEGVSILDVAQFGASLVIFTHSVSNFRLASTIVTEAQDNSIRSIRQGLSNRNRRAFDKLSKETIRIKGSQQGKIDIIRNVNEIPDKQYLNDLFKINKQLNERNIRPSFGSKGQGNIVLNNDISVDTGVLRNSVQHNIGPNVLGQVKQPIPPSYTAAGETSSSSLYGIQPNKLIFNNNLKSDNINLTNFTVESNTSILLQSGTRFLFSGLSSSFFNRIRNMHSFTDLVEWLSEHLPDIFDFVIKMTDSFINIVYDELDVVLQRFISTENVLYRYIVEIRTEFKECALNYLNTKKDEITRKVRRYFESLNANPNSNLLLKCQTCNGSYTTVAL